MTLQNSTSEKEPFPGQLELEFRRLLGKHNSHFDMLNISAQIFTDTLEKQPDEKEYIRDCAKKLGLHSRHPQDAFVNARTYLIYSHLAYIFSAGDQLCERIRSTAYMKNLKNKTPFFNRIDAGDFITKTLALTVLATMPPKNQSLETVNRRVTEIKSHPPFALVNYYRLIRNEELHASGESDRKAAAARDCLPLDKIEAQYRMIPSPVGLLTSNDALLSSKAWQDVAKSLCSHMLSEDEGQSILKKRFGKFKEDRRTAAAKEFMKQELLYSERRICAMMSEVCW